MNDRFFHLRDKRCIGYFCNRIFIRNSGNFSYFFNLFPTEIANSARSTIPGERGEARDAIGDGPKIIREKLTIAFLLAFTLMTVRELGTGMLFFPVRHRQNRPGMIREFGFSGPGPGIGESRPARGGGAFLFISPRRGVSICLNGNGVEARLFLRSRRPGGVARKRKTEP